MSRRYGRNQKRRARAEIAQLEQRTTELQAGMRSQTLEISRQQSQLNDVARIMGTNFIGLQPALRMFSDKHLPDWFRAHVQGGAVMMHTMRTHITTAPDRPDYMMHFRATLMDEVVGYAISECALRDGPEDYLVRCIAEEMARLLMAELRKKFVRSRT